MGKLSMSGSSAHAVRPTAVSSSVGQPSSAAPPEWEVLTLFGRLTEVSSGARTAGLTLTLRLIVEAQKLGEPVAWITDRASSFFPPDAREIGVDLDALACVFLPVRCPRRWAGSPRPLRRDGGLTLHAADLLVRSGGFGLVVLDLGGDVDLPMAMQSRLAGLARRHQTAILCLTEKSKDDRSLGSLISLRVEAERTEKVGDRFRYEARIIKDKHSGSGSGDWQGGWSPGDRVWEEACRAPDGLC